VWQGQSCVEALLNSNQPNFSRASVVTWLLMTLSQLWLSSIVVHQLHCEHCCILYNWENIIRLGFNGHCPRESVFDFPSQSSSSSSSVRVPREGKWQQISYRQCALFSRPTNNVKDWWKRSSDPTKEKDLLVTSGLFIHDGDSWWKRHCSLYVAFLTLVPFWRKKRKLDNKSWKLG